MGFGFVHEVSMAHPLRLFKAARSIHEYIQSSWSFKLYIDKSASSQAIRGHQFLNRILNAVPASRSSSMLPSIWSSAKICTSCNPRDSVSRISISAGMPIPSSLNVNSISSGFIDRSTMLISPSRSFGNAYFNELEMSSLIIRPQGMALSSVCPVVFIHGHYSNTFLIFSDNAAIENRITIWLQQWHPSRFEHDSQD